VKSVVCIQSSDVPIIEIQEVKEKLRKMLRESEILEA
jgi:hypothetical protein